MTDSEFAVKPERPFVGRRDEIDVFIKAVESKIKQINKPGGSAEPTVLVFHGMAGIGKSELRRRLSGKLEATYRAAIWATLDFYDEKCRMIENALFRLRTDLKGRHKIRFPGFDLAYAIYWRKANPQTPLTEKELPLLVEAGLASDIIAALGEIPAIGFVPKAGLVIKKLSKSAQRLWTKRRQSALQSLSLMETHEMLEHLPLFLAWDIRNHVAASRPPLVLFFDTFEALWEKESDAAFRLGKDKWVRGLVRALPEALCIVSGRGKLAWDTRQDENWDGRISHHEIVKLDDEDALSYLSRCGIEDGGIRDVILEGSKGVPLYLALSVDTFENIRKEQEREPVPDDFGKTYEKIFDSFIRNLKSEELSTLKFLSAARKWDKELFKLLCGNFGEIFSDAKFNRFTSFSFVELQADRASWKMHELMREHVQDYVKGDSPELHQSTHEFLFKYFDDQLDDVAVKNVTEVHKTAFTEAFYHASVFKTVQELFKWVVAEEDVFDKSAQWQLSVYAYEKTLRIMEAELPPDNPDLATCMNNLGLIYKNQGRYSEAEPLFQEAIEIHEKALGPEHPHLAIDLNNLAGLYDATGRYSEAEPLYKRVIEIFDKSLGKEHPNIATAVNNLALLYDATGRYSEAEPLFRRAIEIDEKALGLEHPGLATDLNNLAGLYYATGRYSEAEPLFRRAIGIDEKALPTDHPQLAMHLNNLAGLYDDQARYSEAEPLYKRVIEIFENSLGKEHPNVGTAVNNLALLYNARGRYSEAEPLFKRAIEIDEKALGPEHPGLATDLNNLAGLYRATGGYSEAESLYLRALGICEKALGTGHPHFQMVLENIAIFYREWGKEDEARKYEKRLAELRGD